MTLKCNTRNLNFLLGCERILNLNMNDIAKGLNLVLERYPENELRSLGGSDVILSYSFDGKIAKSYVGNKTLHSSFTISKSLDLKPMLYVVKGNEAKKIQHINRCPLEYVIQPEHLELNENNFDFKTASKIVPMYTVYTHIFQNREQDKNYQPRKIYVGITKQGWTARWNQHINAAKTGSSYLFHQAIRECKEWCQLHNVIGFGYSFEEAMDLEESLVSKFSLNALYPDVGLNMIPGGFAGLRYLAKNGFNRVSPKQWENRGRLIREYNAHCERIGKPNQALSLKWMDDEFAKKMIFSNPRNMTFDQVQRIRQMAEFDIPAKEIASATGLEMYRISGLLRGKTFSRVQ